MYHRQASEHRWSERQPLAFTVRLDDGARVVEGIAHNLSLGGLYVETGLHALMTNDPVTVSFAYPLPDETGYFRLHATVIWTSPYGAGLMFRDFDPETLHALRRLLHPR